MSRFLIIKFLKEGILRGSYMWLFIGVFTTFLKIISIVGLIEKKRKYFTSELKVGDRINLLQSPRTAAE